MRSPAPLRELESLRAQAERLRPRSQGPRLTLSSRARGARGARGARAQDKAHNIINGADNSLTYEVALPWEEAPEMCKASHMANVMELRFSSKPFSGGSQKPPKRRRGVQAVMRFERSSPKSHSSTPQMLVARARGMTLRIPVR